MEDIKKKIEEIVKKVKNDKDFASKFKKDPIKAVESILGVDLPDDKIKSIIDGVKAKITSDKISSSASKLADKVKDLF
ncbi:MAG: hypothetical protein J6X02_02925 [Bacilli bacterium]|nr:hypothetical protein [Bacilli bacterium]